MGKARVNNFELLRVVAMLMVVFHHFVRQTQWNIGKASPTEPTGRFIKHVLLLYLRSLGKVGVEIYLLISGYFLNTRNASVKSVLRVWFRTTTWTMSIYFCLSWIREMSYNDFFSQAFPVLTGQYWYVTSYIGLMCFSPGLAVTIKHLNQRQMVGIMGFLFLVVNLFAYIQTTKKIHGYFSTLWVDMFLPYLLGAYFKMYPKVLSKVPTWAWTIIAVGTIIFDTAQLYYFETNNPEFKVHNGNSAFFLITGDYAPLSIGIALPWFLLFKSITLPEGWFDKFAGIAGSCTFGVYIGHENPILRGYLWNKWVRAQDHFNEWYSPFVLFLAPLSVYTAFSVLEFIRQKIFSYVELYFVKYMDIALRFIATKTGDLLLLEKEGDHNRNNAGYERVGSESTEDQSLLLPTHEDGLLGPNDSSEEVCLETREMMFVAAPPPVVSAMVHGDYAAVPSTIVPNSLHNSSS